MDLIFEYIMHEGSCDEINNMPILTYTISGVDLDFYPNEDYIESEFGDDQ